MFDPSTFENFIFSQARTLSINDDLRQMILPKIYRLPRLRLSHLGTFSHVKRVYVKYTVAVVAAARAHIQHLMRPSHRWTERTESAQVVSYTAMN